MSFANIRRTECEASNRKYDASSDQKINQTRAAKSVVQRDSCVGGESNYDISVRGISTTKVTVPSTIVQGRKGYFEHMYRDHMLTRRLVVYRRTSCSMIVMLYINRPAHAPTLITSTSCNASAQSYQCRLYHPKLGTFPTAPFWPFATSPTASSTLFTSLVSPNYFPEICCLLEIIQVDTCSLLHLVHVR